MSDPFDTGIRLTVSPDPARVRCDVDEFVLCPSNARADEAITARDEWQRLAQAEAWDHLVTAKRLVEAEVALAQAEHLHAEAESDLARLSVRLIEAEVALAAARAEVERAQGASWVMPDALDRTLARIASAMGCDPDDDADLVEAVCLLVKERDAAVQRAERAESMLAAVVCTGCGVRMGDAMCGKCASRPAEERAVARIVAWLRWEATLDEHEDNNEDAEQSRRTADAIEAGAWRGEEAP